MSETPKVTRNSGLAICSLVLGILSLVGLGLLSGIPAVICGHMAQSRIKRSAGALGGGDLAVAGLIIGYVGTVVVSLVIVVLFFIPVTSTTTVHTF